MARVDFRRSALYDGTVQYVPYRGAGSVLFNRGVYEVVRSVIDVCAQIGGWIVGN